MRRAATAFLSLGALAAVCATASAGPGSEGGQWQGRSPEPLRAELAKPSGFPRAVLLNSGGSGGVFGKGDERFDLKAIAFANPSEGWASGTCGVFRSSDGGFTWKPVEPHPVAKKRETAWHRVALDGAKDVWLLEGKHGVSAGWLWHSSDAGATWTEEIPGKLNGYADLFAGGGQVWALGSSPPVQTSFDGGKTWQANNCGGLLRRLSRIDIPQHSLTGSAYAVFILGEDAKGQPALVKSLDAGKSWSLVKTPQPLPGPHYRCQLFFADAATGWLSGFGGFLLRTADGGESWTRCDLPDAERESYATALWFDSLGAGYAAVSNLIDYKPRRETALYFTDDGGRSWTPLLSGQKQINGLYGLGGSLVWAVGNVPGGARNDIVAILQRD